LGSEQAPDLGQLWNLQMASIQKKWIELITADFTETPVLTAALGVNRVLANLMIHRGVRSFDEAKDFFRPELRHLHDPFLMKDMAVAVSRIEKAISEEEKMAIYGDYDVDGTTAVALVFSFFRRIYSKLDFYVPDRHKEGYGISRTGIDWAAEKGYTLIIALDCGIKAIDEVAYAHSKGIDFIIGDHHMPGEELPGAIAVLDPKRKDCFYPYDELSGCGIGFKLVQAFAMRNHFEESTYYRYLDLVAVSVAADIIPLTGENRIMAHYGLKKLNSDPCFGLEALIKLTGREGPWTTEDIVFQIGPRINAAGRIEHAKDAVHLLISHSPEEATRRCAGIDLYNIERKSHDLRITGEALAMIESDHELMDRKTTVVYQHDWHKGVIGIVASRLTEKYYRPTIVLTRSNNVVTGSARSVRGFDLYAALNACGDLFVQFGGHKYAAGLTMKEENVVALQERFEHVVSSSIPPELLVPEIRIDHELHLSEITAKFFRILRQFAPFGPANHAPVFLSKGVRVLGSPSLVGEKHLRVAICQEDSPVFNCIGFGMAEYLPLVGRGVPLDLCYCIEENVWRDNRSIQLNLKGIRASKV